ncbi:hypothetical protein [Bifidobacterium adolescentis]|uniref:hypothetical protein n=1 Tax=Bifidobacterium adolescentis TaxID=1680 RepID=UPI0034A36B9D
MTVITEANKTKARELTAQLTLDEKIAIVHAAGLFRNGNAERLGIPPLRMDDGPMGVRAELHNDNWAPLYNTRDYVTYLPSGSAVASTWNPDLARMTGEVLGEEARGRGKDVILGPSINIKRSPLCGRNFRIHERGSGPDRRARCGLHPRRAGIRRGRLRETLRGQQPGNRPIGR